MARKSSERSRYGIGEWYGKRIETLSPSQKHRYARITGSKKEVCPHRPGPEMCNKNGGVCSLAIYVKQDNQEVILDPTNRDLVTICPMRFWQNLTLFKAVGSTILQTETPTLIREIGFLQSVDQTGRISADTVGRIDMVLARTDRQDKIEDWCALEMQAVYFSGRGMRTDFKAIADEPSRLLFPTETRRPDYRSSGPKRLMPQLQIKVPSLR